MHRVPTKTPGPPGWLVAPSREVVNLPQDTPSESSEADTSEDDYNDEDDWDSGKCLLPCNKLGHSETQEEL